MFKISWDTLPKEIPSILRCLRSIASGLTAQSAVNCDTAKKIEQEILKFIEGQKVVEYTFHQKNQAMTMNTKSSIRIRDEVVTVVPLLLFQRLVTTGTRFDDLLEIFKHELCSYPPSLFESPQMMRFVNKVTLADSLWLSANEAALKPPNSVHIVLDGVALLYPIPWTKGTNWAAYSETVDSTCQSQIWETHSCIWWVSGLPKHKGQ